MCGDPGPLACRWAGAKLGALCGLGLCWHVSRRRVRVATRPLGLFRRVFSPAGKCQTLLHHMVACPALAPVWGLGSWHVVLTSLHACSGLPIPGFSTAGLHPGGRLGGALASHPIPWGPCFGGSSGTGRDGCGLQAEGDHVGVHGICGCFRGPLSQCPMRAAASAHATFHSN